MCNPYTGQQQVEGLTLLFSPGTGPARLRSVWGAQEKRTPMRVAASRSAPLRLLFLELALAMTDVCR